jgi:hypothetical protein
VRQAEKEGEMQEKEAAVLKILARGMRDRQGTRKTREIPHQQSTPHTSPVLSLCSFHPCPVLVEGSSEAGEGAAVRGGCVDASGSTHAKEPPTTTAFASGRCDGKAGAGEAAGSSGSSAGSRREGGPKSLAQPR